MEKEEEIKKSSRPFISNKRYENIKDKLNSLLQKEEIVNNILGIICDEINFDPNRNTYKPRMKEHMKRYRENLKLKKLNDIRI